MLSLTISQEHFFTRTPCWSVAPASRREVPTPCLFLLSPSMFLISSRPWNTISLACYQGVNMVFELSFFHIILHICVQSCVIKSKMPCASVARTIQLWRSISKFLEKLLLWSEYQKKFYSDSIVFKNTMSEAIQMLERFVFKYLNKYNIVFWKTH